MRLSSFLMMVFAANTALADANFAYRITGDRQAAPLQVFDNNGKTYLQVRDIAKPLAVFDESGSTVPFIVESPYLVLPNVYRELTVRYGKNYGAKISGTSAPKIVYPGHEKNYAQYDKNVWFGGTVPDVITGMAERPVPVKDMAHNPQQADSLVIAKPQDALEFKPNEFKPKPKNEMAGRFFIDEPIMMGPDETKEVKERETSEPLEVLIVFKPREQRVSAAQVVLLANVAKGNFASYRLRHSITNTGRSRASQVRERLISMGVSPGRIILEGRSSDDESSVVLSGEKN